MSSEPFPPSLDDEIKRLCRKIDDQGKEHWWIKPIIAAAFEAAGYHLLPRHFYTPVADPTTVAATDFDSELYPLSNLIFEETSALTFLKSVSQYSDELESQFPVGVPTESGFYWDNFFFTGLDAAVLYTMVRTLQPKRMVEIGSGFSTHIAQRALELNGKGELTCFEPYPTPKLMELSDRIQIVQKEVQKTTLDSFSSLESGDILFIDSSHVSCLGSDVNYEVLDILPILPKGAIVHIHDIFLPFEYPHDWVVNRRWHWNEQYLLYAFLRMNDCFEVWMPNSYMIRRHPEKVRGAIPFLGPLSHSGVSFWLRKVR